MFFLFLYSLISAAGVYLDYRAGLYVEDSYGPQVSLIFFLVMFFVAIIAAFPIAARLSPADKD